MSPDANLCGPKLELDKIMPEWAVLTFGNDRIWWISCTYFFVFEHFVAREYFWDDLSTKP